MNGTTRIIEIIEHETFYEVYSNGEYFRTYMKPTYNRTRLAARFKWKGHLNAKVWKI